MRGGIADQLRLLLPSPSEPCERCGSDGEWMQLERPAGWWVCGGCHAGCPLEGCSPPPGLDREEQVLWHLGTAARGGDREALRAFLERLAIYERSSRRSVSPESATEESIDEDLVPA